MTKTETSCDRNGSDWIGQTEKSCSDEFVPGRGKPGGKWACFAADRSGVRFSGGSYQDLANWNCSPLTRRTLWGGAAEPIYRTHTTLDKSYTNRPFKHLFLALQDHCVSMQFFNFLVIEIQAKGILM